MTPIRPLESEADALALPFVAAIYARAREPSRPGVMAGGNREMLTAALESAGVTLGAYEEHIFLEWLPQWAPQTVAVVAGVIRRAHLTGLAAAETEEDGTDG